MKTVRIISVVTAFLSITVILGCKKEAEVSKLSLKEQLGKKLFFDASLSTPPGQSCASCHSSLAGWTGPDSNVNSTQAAYEGAVQGRFGNTKPPSAAYAGDSPVMHRDEEGVFVGGMFWNGRASGLELGDPLAEQAMGPFLNPLEMNNPDKKTVVVKVSETDYVDLFEEVWGDNSLSLDDVDGTFERIARAIAAFERSAEVNPFSSKFDDFWKNAKDAGLDVESIDESNWTEYKNLGLDDEEVEGLMLFNTKGLCAECHVMTSVDGKPPLFTDFTYDNIGVPRNPQNPFYKMSAEWNKDDQNWVDRGLETFLEITTEFAPYAAENSGKQKVPTLRNVDKRPHGDFVKAYAHNGFFKTLKDITRFYNTRDIASESWPPPEIEENVNTEELGDLGLTEREEDLIVKFMETLSDR